MKKYIYKERFFFEDEEFCSPNYFSASITDETAEERFIKNWVQFDVGGGTNNNLSYGFNLDDKESRENALICFSNLYIGIKNLYEKLRIVCKDIDEEEIAEQELKAEVKEI